MGSVIETMQHEARISHPNECCGILLGEGGAIRQARPAANVHPRPQTRFAVDPQALIDVHRAARNGGPQVLGYYHSHPHGEPAPSARDREGGIGDGMLWAILAGDTVGWWRDAPGGFVALSLDLISG